MHTPKIAYAETKAQVDAKIKELEAQYESAKARASASVKGAQADVDAKVARGEAAATEKKDQAKAGWFSWLGWGKAQAKEAKHDAAADVAQTAENVRNEAAKRA
jgi:hypothetical protein